MDSETALATPLISDHCLVSKQTLRYRFVLYIFVDGSFFVPDAFCYTAGTGSASNRRTRLLYSRRVIYKVVGWPTPPG